MTYEGASSLGFREHEFPCVYLRYNFNRLVYYAGDAPWTNGAVTDRKPDVVGTASGTPSTTHVALERWAALVDARDFGVTLWTPGAYAYFRSVDFSSARTMYLVRPGYMNYGPNRVIEHDAYVYIGDYKAARASFSRLRTSVPILDGEVPTGNLESPLANDLLTGTIAVRGWAFDNTAVTRIEVLVDDKVLATGGVPATPRTDVQRVYPYASPNSGFSVPLDTRSLPNGPALVTLRVYDTAGHVLVLPVVPVTVRN